MFKSLEGFEEIEVNDEGEIRWSGSGKPFYLHDESRGAHRAKNIKYRPSFNGPHKFLSPYRMIATLFVPNPDNYKFVKPIDGDYANLKASNLKWVRCSRDT